MNYGQASKDSWDFTKLADLYDKFFQVKALVGGIGGIAVALVLWHGLDLVKKLQGVLQ